VKDPRVLPARALRQLAQARSNVTASDLVALIEGSLSPEAPLAAPLAAAMRDAAARAPSPLAAAAANGDAEMNEGAAKAEGADGNAGGKEAPPPPPTALPEAEALIALAVVARLVDEGRPDLALPLARAAVDRIISLNRRSLDLTGARLVSHLSLCHERTGTAPALRSSLLGWHRTATLRHDEPGRDCLLNLVLRNYLGTREFALAEAFRLQTEAAAVSGARDRAEGAASAASSGGAARSGPQQCRHLHYLGRLRAVQLDYSGARDCLQQALRKAPAGAKGFRASTTQWLTVVQLLLGVVPDRADLVGDGSGSGTSEVETEGPLVPYLELTRAVREGDLSAFAAVIAARREAFEADGTELLALRLRANVIRSGLRRIVKAYSRISVADVAERLGLCANAATASSDVLLSAEHVIAKTIYDGAVDAALERDPVTGISVLTSADPEEAYEGFNPQAALHERVAFCLDLHNEAARALRYDPSRKNASGKDRGRNDQGEDGYDSQEEAFDDFDPDW